MNPAELLFEPEELREARTAAIDDLTDELRCFARKAKKPVQRAALSELEQLILATREQWAAKGLVKPQAELVA